MTPAPTDKISLGSLDHNGQIPVHMEPVQILADEPSSLHLIVDTSSLTARTLLDPDGHLREGLRVYADGELVNTQIIDDHKRHQFAVDALLPPNAKTVTLCLYGEPAITLNRSGDSLVHDTRVSHERIPISDWRTLATSEVRPPRVPAHRTLFAGFDAKKHAPITDLHTHSSAQISNARLMEMALKRHLDYPVELLGRLDDPITLSETERKQINVRGGTGMRFSPMEHEGLSCERQNELCDVIPLSALTPENRAKLEKQLQIPQDITMCFSEFDKRYYRFVNPLVKNPALAKDMIMEIGRSYAEHGVRYAELSTASMLNIDANGDARWFKEMIDATAEVERQYGVQLRYLIGVPRTYSPQKVMIEIEKIKYAARHPLIAGVDLLGYESNRTEDFSAALNNIATWAKAPSGTDLKPEEGWDFRRDFTIRVHAGETNKNSGNVHAAVKIADKHKVQVRIAHALNELDDRSMDRKIAKLSEATALPQLVPGKKVIKLPLVSMEFCPDSNIGYNNVQSVSHVPFMRWLECCKSWFLGSDGSGAIQTNPEQIALSAIAAGVTLPQMEQLRAREEDFIAQKQEAFSQKSEAFQKHYGAQSKGDNKFLKGLSERIKDVSNPQRNAFVDTQLPAEFEGKMPILVAGASLSSWDDLGKAVQTVVNETMRLLVATVDPEKAYFVLGRTKREGLTAALDNAIMEYNDQHPTKPFQVLGLTTEDTRQNANSIQHLITLPGDRDSVPEKTIQFMRESKVPGICLFMGGKTYTSDMIRHCFPHRDTMNYLLMETAPGASQDWAKKSKDSRKFSNAVTLIPRMAETLHDRMGDQNIFRSDVDPFDYKALNALRQEITAPTFQDRLGDRPARSIGGD